MNININIDMNTDINTDKYLVCFTDGSASKNGDRNCIGSYACYFPNDIEYNIQKIITENVTNNRAEYLAAITAMKQLFKYNQDHNTNKKLIIYSDSLLLVNTVNDWMHRWQKNNWTRSSKKPLENLDLVKKLYELYNSNIITIKWIKAHSKDQSYESQMNNIVDEMSRYYMDVLQYYLKDQSYELQMNNIIDNILFE